MNSSVKIFPIQIVPVMILIFVFSFVEINAQQASSEYVKVQIGKVSVNNNFPLESSEAGDNYFADFNDELSSNIPLNKTKHTNRFALIIGNENYSVYGMGPGNVEFAANDALIFREYAIKVLGVPEENIICRINATSGVMVGLIERQYLILKNAGKNPELIFYYAGHGYPCALNTESGIVPVDADPSLAEGPLSLRVVLEKLASVNGSYVMAITDACFTGEGRKGPVIMAQRGISYSPGKYVLPENVILMAASQGNQAAFPYASKNHGLFTYFFLKELQQSYPDETWGTLMEKVSGKVAFESVRMGFREQQPIVRAGYDLADKWKSIYLRK